VDRKERNDEWRRKRRQIMNSIVLFLVVLLGVMYWRFLARLLVAGVAFLLVLGLAFLMQLLDTGAASGVPGG
jgi:purine-cytosine permease-like protein